MSEELTRLYPRYIVNSNYSSSLNYAESHFEIAFSCISYLNTTHSFWDSENSRNALRLSVASGFHSLHPYANEFWLQHLAQYAKCRVELDQEGHLELILAKLATFWKSEPGEAAKRLKIDDTTTADSIRNQLSELDRKPMIKNMGLDIQIFRAYLSQEKFSHQQPNGKFH